MPITRPSRRRRRRPQDDGPPPGQYPGTIAPQPPMQHPRAYHPAMPWTEALLPSLMSGDSRPLLGPQLGPYGLRSVGDRNYFPLAETLSDYQPGDPVGGPAVPLGGGGIPDSGAYLPPPAYRKVIDESGVEIITPPAGGLRQYGRGNFQSAPPPPGAPVRERRMPPLGGEGRIMEDVERCHLCRRTPIVGARHPAGPSVGMCPRCGKAVCPDCEVKHALAGYTRHSFPCPSQH